jgi:hypothetical protein
MECVRLAESLVSGIGSSLFMLLHEHRGAKMKPEFSGKILCELNASAK